MARHTTEKKPLASALVSADDGSPSDNNTLQRRVPGAPNDQHQAQQKRLQQRERIREIVEANQTKHATRYQGFADALRAAMKKANMTASDVARQIWGTTTNPRGYEIARNRDRISQYLTGNSYPGPENLQKLADAVGVHVSVLQIDNPPRYAVRRQPSLRRAATPGAPALEGTQLVLLEGEDAGLARLTVDRVIPVGLAMQIAAALVEYDKAADDAVGLDQAEYPPPTPCPS